MRLIRDFLSLVKIGIVGSNALTAAAGFALAVAWAGGAARNPALPGRGALVVGGTALLVAGSCVVNNWLDRDIDALMERTRDRPTARGALGPVQTLGLGALLGAAGLGLLMRASLVAAALGLGAALVYLVPYTLWTKRRGRLSLYIGGIAGALPPLIGWAGLNPRLGGAAWALFAFLALWQQAHVRALALKRAQEYRAAGLPMAGLGPLASPPPSTAARGDRGRPKAAVLLWAAATLPFPGLAIVLAGPPLAGVALAAAAGSCALGLSWIAWGLAGFRSPAWPGRMFAASLVYLILVFCSLILVRG
jgi:heme o synthase